MQKKAETSYTSVGLQPFHLILVLKSIPYSDLRPFLNPNGPEKNSVSGLVPGFKSTL